MKNTKAAVGNGGMKHDDTILIASRCDLEAKLSGKGDSDDVGDHLPRICSVKHLFEVYLDICGLPR